MFLREHSKVHVCMYMFVHNNPKYLICKRLRRFARLSEFCSGANLVRLLGECPELLGERAVDAELLSRKIADAYQYRWRTVEW